MAPEDLKNALQSLHHELQDTSNLDDSTRQLLQSLVQDIQSALDKSPSEDDTAAADPSLSERLRQAVIEFEVRHPQIGGILERLTDGLANLGI
ncbi:MAG: DUF4404 family protein [Planctomycetaceae bacterium]|nr:DUF4404 family protein [Planctomycetaceae bacterium]